MSISLVVSGQYQSVFHWPLITDHYFWADWPTIALRILPASWARWR